MSSALLPRGEAQALPKRGITEATARKWSYEVGKDRAGDTVQIANFKDDDGTIVGQQTRDKDKNFRIYGDISEMLYGKWLWRNGGKRVWITEGQLDALTVSQVLDNKWNVVSIPHGVKSARKAIAANIKWLNNFDQVCICFDQDEPGRLAVQEVVGLFPPGKVSIVSLPLNDPNEMLKAGRTQELIDALWGAKPYRPDGIVNIVDIRDKVLKPVEMGFPWCFPWFTAKTYGRRYGELISLGAGSGCGKTTMLTQQIEFDLQNVGHVGAFLFEQPVQETVQRIAGQRAGKTFHIPDGTWTHEELTTTVDDLQDSPNELFLYDHFGACDWNVVREQIRYLNKAKGVRLFYIDHITALAAMEPDEKKAIEQMMAELGGMVKELDIWICIVSHLATPDGLSHEEGGRVMGKHFKGSRAIMQWSHIMIGLERDTQADDPVERNKTTFRCLKDRSSGRANGYTKTITYEENTGRLVDAPDDYEQPAFGDETKGDEF